MPIIRPAPNLVKTLRQAVASRDEVWYDEGVEVR